MSVVGVGDPEFSTVTDLDETMAKWAGFNESFYPWPVFQSMIGGLAKTVYNIFNKPLYCCAGDFISKRVQASALKQACGLYLKLKKGGSLDEYLQNYKASSQLSFKEQDIGNSGRNQFT